MKMVSGELIVVTIEIYIKAYDAKYYKTEYRNI